MTCWKGISNAMESDTIFNYIVSSWGFGSFCLSNLILYFSKDLFHMNQRQYLETTLVKFCPERHWMFKY